MYAIPIALLIFIALIATAWSPIFALIIAVPLFVVFLAYIGFRPRADEKVGSPLGEASSSSESDVSKGIWGEKRADPGG
jgi:hypothetical protein